MKSPVKLSTLLVATLLAVGVGAVAEETEILTPGQIAERLGLDEKSDEVESEDNDTVKGFPTEGTVEMVKVEEYSDVKLTRDDDDGLLLLTMPTRRKSIDLDIRFQVGSAKTKADRASKDNLDALAKLIEEYEGYHFIVEGHASDEGSDFYNLNLSRKRVEEIEKFLLKEGVPRRRLFALFFGEYEPKIEVEDSDSYAEKEKKRKKNRRVTIRVAADLDIDRDTLAEKRPTDEVIVYESDETQKSRERPDNDVVFETD